MIIADLTIGETWYPSVGEFRLISWRGRPLTLMVAKVPLAPVEKGAEVTLKYGYAETAEWSGVVTDVDKGGDLMTVTAAGKDELKLTETTFRESFIEETAEIIIKSALSKTGLSIAKIDSPGVPIARYTAADIPVWQAIKQVEESLRSGYGLTGFALWAGSGGLRWTTGDEPGDVPEIATNVNLVDHAPSDTGLSRVTSFFLPGLSHSRRFKLTDSRRGMSGTYRAEIVKHELKNLHGRTHVYYRRSE